MKLKTAFFLSLVFAACCPAVYAGIFTEEYGVSSYEITIPTHIGSEIIPYEISIPERHGQPIEKVKAIVIYQPGVGSAVAFPANERWHRWLYENELAYMHVGDEYEITANILGALTNFSGMVLGGNSYPELAYAPVMPYGESAGGTDAFYIAKDAPEKTIAFIAEATQYWDDPIPEAMKLVPGYFRWGEFDYERWDNSYVDIVGDNIKDKLNAGAQWMCAAEPRQTHATTRYAVEEAMGYFSLMLPLRYDYQEGVTNHDPRLGPVELNTIVRTNGWLGEHKFGALHTDVSGDELANFLKDWESRDPYYAPYQTAERKDKLEHSWMPDEKTAIFWATKSPYGEHDLVMTHFDTLEDDLGSSTVANRGSYFPNMFTVGQSVRVAVEPSGFTNTVQMQFWMDNELVATDDIPPYEHAYTFTTNQAGVHFIYPIAIDELGGRCVGRRRILQVYSNVRNGNTAPTVSDIDPFIAIPGSTVQIPITVHDTETAASSLSVSWQKINNTDNIVSTDYNASITGSGSNRILNLTLPDTNSIIWGLVQVSDGDMSVAEYVQVNVSAIDGYAAPFFVEGEVATAAGRVFEAGSWSKRVSAHVYDYDTPVEDLTLTAFSSNQSMLPNANIVVGGTGRFRYVKVKPLSAGYCTVSLVLSDGRTSITNTFGIPANAANDFAPIISDIPDQSLAGGRTGEPIEVRVYDMQTPSEPIVPGLTTLDLSITSDNQSLLADSNITITASGDRRFVSLKPKEGTSGTVTLMAIVTDTDNSTATDTFSVVVSAEGALSGVSETLPTAYLGQTYSEMLRAEGGVEPLSWSLSSGSLPAGLSLNSDGSFSGTASTTGTTAFVAQVVDANSSTGTASCSISVEPWLIVPSNFTAIAQPDVSVTLSWSDLSIGESGYEIQRRNRNYLMWTSIVTLTANSTNYNDSDVTSGAQYDYRVRPVGGSFSDITSVETLATPSISVQPQSDNVPPSTSPELYVTASGGQLCYQWYQGTSGDTSSPLNGATDKIVTISNIQTTASFWVRITNALGQVNSATATLTVDSIAWPIYVDFGDTATISPDSNSNYWNNVLTKSGTFGPFVDSNGKSTEITLTPTISFQNVWTAELPTNTLYPATAENDALRPFNGDGAFRLDGLETNTNYELTFFSAIPTSGDQTTRFAIGSVTQAVQSSYNTTNLVIFSEIQPNSSGQITVTIISPPLAYGFLNVMELSKSPDPVSIELSETSVAVPEGSNATFNVRLTENPETTRTVTVSRVSGDSDLTVASGSPAVFTTNNWDEWQTITLQAAEDSDTTDSSAIFQCLETSLTPVQLTATETDNDLAIQVADSTLTVIEGGSTNLLVRLNTAPSSAYTVTVNRVSGDSSISISSGAQLVFTAADYMNWQTAVISAAQDGDQADGSAIIRLSSASSDNVDVTVTEQDDDYTIVATGLLTAWKLDSVVQSPTVLSTNAYFTATGLVSSALTHSDTSEMRGANNALKAIDNDGADFAAAISDGNYFYWQLTPESNHVITITSVVFRAKCDSPAESFLLSDASGLTAANVLATNGSAAAAVTADLSANANFQGLENPVEFRVYGYKGANPFNALYIGNSFISDGLDDIQVYGSVAYSAPSEPSDDADADGLPDSWETEHFGGDANPDSISSNGVNTVREAYIAGLDPNNPAARFQIDSADFSSRVLQWTSVSGRVYNIYWASNLLSGFERIESNFTGGAFTDQVHGAELKGFYKIEVEVAP